MSLLRVMSFNVNGASDEDETNGWTQRAPLCLRLLRRYAPDLIGFQEVEEKNLEFFQNHLAEYGFARGNRYDVEPYAARTSVFWKAARFERIEEGEFWLSQTPDRPSCDWDVPYPLGATWVKLRCRETGRMLVHLNTHFEDGPDGETSRAEGARLIAERLGRLQAGALPAVVTGDFNANPWSVPYRLFMGSGFSDSYRAAGHGDSVDSSSYHGFQGRGYFAPDWGEQLFWRVDWILARDGAAPVRSVSSSIVREAEPPLYPSDHYPVVSELLMEEE